MDIKDCVIGKKYICLPGFTTEDHSGGAGYKSGKIFTIAKIYSYWVGPLGEVNGIYARAIEPHESYELW